LLRCTTDHAVGIECVFRSSFGVNYSDQRNHKPRIFHNGGPRCDRHCPYHGTLYLCEKRGFSDRERGTISIGVNWMAPSHAWSMIIVQACDAVIGGTINDPMKTYGPAVTALLNLVAVIWLIQALP
jgi:hypothetical protein